MITKTYSFTKENTINEVYTLSNACGSEVDILTYGARIIRISVPDKNGDFSDVIVGCKTPEDYYGKNPYFGATIGRYGNRIGGAKFTLNGKEFNLEPNNNGNTLHGGITGDFSRKVWQAEINGDTLVLSHTSPDNEGGFPGTLAVKVFFTLTDENALVIEYAAVSDKDTVCNLTNHSYFNIGYQDTVLSHELMIKSRKITAVDDELIPHGEYMDIDGTVFSFLHPKTIGQDIFCDEHLIKHCNGYDFNYCLDRIGRGLEHAAYVYDKESGRRMDCYTTLPGIQLYTGNMIEQGRVCKDGACYPIHAGICLETQAFPNSLKYSHFPNPILKKNEKYDSITEYKFK